MIAKLQQTLFVAGALFALTVVAGPAWSDERCNAPAPVCAMRDAVFVISSFDPFASAVRIAPNRLVTNRHTVADARTVELTRKDGSKIEAAVVSAAYRGDLVLIETDKLGDGPVLGGETGDSSGALYTIGGDISRRSIRVYKPGRRLLERAKDAPFARLHHSAYSQPGNSGGAVVDKKGRLVGIAASGGEGRFEAIPAGEIAKLAALSGPDHAESDAEIGTATRICTLLLERASPRALGLASARRISTACTRSANRQLFDLAAQALGRGRQLDASIAMSEAAVARDPHAINSRITLVTSLHIAGRYEDELAHLKFLMKVIPDDPVVHRYAIQAGKWGGDEALARRALDLLRQHNPAQAEAAQRFFDADIPRPRRRTP